MATPIQMQQSSQTVEVIPDLATLEPDSWGFRWPVAFKIEKAEPSAGWIVQQVTVRYRTWTREEGKLPVFYPNKILLADGSFLDKPEVTYWEAWPVPARQTCVYWPSPTNRRQASTKIAFYPDEYLVIPDPHTGETDSKGEVKVLGIVAFYLGELPDVFNESTASSAGVLPMATTKPDFWTGTGTAHNLMATWNGRDPKRLLRLQMEPKLNVKGIQGGQSGQRSLCGHLNPSDNLDWNAW